MKYFMNAKVIMNQNLITFKTSNLLLSKRTINFVGAVINNFVKYFDNFLLILKQIINIINKEIWIKV